MKVGDRVRVENTNTAFDGKEGVLEEMQDDYCVVFVDFIPNTDKRVRQNFSFDNIVPVSQEVATTEEDFDFEDM